MAYLTSAGQAAIEQVLVEQKRALVGPLSTVLDPLPGTSSRDTSIILQALERAAEMFTSLSRSPLGLSLAGEQVRQQVLNASELLRRRIQQERPEDDEQGFPAVPPDTHLVYVGPEGETGPSYCWIRRHPGCQLGEPGIYLVRHEQADNSWRWQRVAE